MGFWKVYLVASITVLLIIGYVIWASFFGPQSPEDNPSKYALAQVLFSAVTVIGIIFTLLYATVQFRKSLASPNLKLAFDEEGSTKKCIGFEMTQTGVLDLPIYAYNKGNRVASMYQIELKIPIVFQSYLVRAVEGDRVDGKKSSDSESWEVSFYSYGKPEYTCFIDKYVHIGLTRLKVGNGAKLQSKKLKIEYKIFGDWGKHQEGKLLLELQAK